MPNTSQQSGTRRAGDRNLAPTSRPSGLPTKAVRSGFYSACGYQYVEAVGLDRGDHVRVETIARNGPSHPTGIALGPGLKDQALVLHEMLRLV